MCCLASHDRSLAPLKFGQAAARVSAALRVLSSCVAVVLLAGGCAGEEVDSAAFPLRLVDLFPEAELSGGPAVAGDEPPTVWSFAGPGPHGSAWQAGPGLADVRIEDGVLTATSGAASPILHVEWSPDAAQADGHIHSIEIRMRASAGGAIGFSLSREDELELGSYLAPDNPFAWTLTSPLMAGDEMQLYVLRPVNPLPAAGVRHLLLRPVDVPDAELAIESVRVVFEREHLRAVPSGVSWQGLDGVFRETIVTRAPETVRYQLTLPSRPWLDLAIGTLEEGETTFRIRVAPAGREEDDRTVAVRRAVTAARSWEPLTVDLEELAGETVALTLELDSASGGALGLWGSPVVRQRVEDEMSPQGVVVVLMDTLRRDHLDMYGYERPTAPVLSQLAAEGVLVQDALSQATWTKVSVPSIMTSLYPRSHTVKNLPDLLPASATTMAEVFRQAGWATLGFSAIPFTGKMTNLHQGYEVFHESAMDVSTGGIPEKSARRHVDLLLPWLERHRDVPFFVFLHVEDPHSPYFAPPPYATQWGEEGDADTYRELIDEVRPKIENPLMRRFGMPLREDLEEAGIDAERYVDYELDAYDGLIRSMDAQLERLLEKLAALGLDGRVLLAFTSDHGTEFLDHGAHFHGQSVYGELNRVPMFFWGAGVPAGVRIPVTVETVDFMPTVLELTGLPVPETVQGQSLVPWFGAQGREAAAAEAGWRRKPAITEKAALDPRLPGRAYESLSIVSEGWKLVHNVDPPPGVPEYELYDHREDPLNLEDVAEEHPERVERLARQLEGWRQMAESSRLENDEALAADASPEELERLRALGYI